VQTLEGAFQAFAEPEVVEFRHEGRTLSAHKDSKLACLPEVQPLCHSVCFVALKYDSVTMSKLCSQRGSHE
jgi:hypothetical protein